MTFEIWFYFVKDKFCRERRGTEQLLLRFSEPNQRFISLNPLSIRIPSNSSLCWLVTTTRARERENLDRVTQQCKENKGNDFDYGWMRPDLSRQVWHVLTHLLISGRSLPSHHKTHWPCSAMKWHGPCTHQSYFIIGLQCSYLQAIIFSSLVLVCHFYWPSLISQILGEIFAQDGANPPDPAKLEPVLIIDEYFVSGLISSAVPGVRNNIWQNY